MKSYLRTILVVAAFFGVRTTMYSQTYNVYFGDIHSHSWYSDGNQDQNPSTYTKPVARSITYAKSSPSMHFLGISDHNHVDGGFPMTLNLWRSGHLEADSVNQDGTFVGLYGQEWGTTASGGGHSLIYGTDKLFGWNPGIYDVYVPKNDFARLIDSVKKYNGFIYLAHPQSDDFDGLFTGAYNALWDSVVVGTAMKNGPSTSTNTTETNPSSTDYTDRYNDLLKKGYHVAPCANQDNHNTTFGRANQQRTAVLATSLTKANILDALKNRRAYATEDHNLQVKFEVGSHQMGEIFTVSDTIKFRIKVTDAGESFSTIELRYGVPGSGSVPTVLASASSRDSLVYSRVQPVNTTYYYYAYVREADGQEAWSAPMWINVVSGTLPGSFALSSPSNSSTNQGVTGTLNWQTSSDATQYDVYLGTTNPPTTLVSQNQVGTSYNYSGLLNGTAYYWKVVAKNGAGSTTATAAPWSFTTSLAAPGAFAQVLPGDAAIEQPLDGILKWRRSTNATSYDVYFDTLNPPVTVVSNDQTDTTYSYSGLSVNGVYYWKVIAKNETNTTAGTGTPWSFSTIAYPLAFLQTLPVQGDTSFLLSGNLEWEASANATGYDVYMDGNNPPTTLLVENTTLTSYNVTGLLPNTTYYWSVVASNTNASLEASNSPMQFRTANVPTMVSNLTATLRASSLITLEWQDSIENETGFRIYRSSNIEGPFEQTGVDLPVSSVAFTDTGLSPNKRYYYKVVAFNEPGEGIPTQLDALTLAETPPAPAILSAEYNAVQLVVNPDGNSPLTEFAIEVSDSAATYFVESDDVLGVTPAWKTEAGWGAVTGVSITGVQACAQYKIRVKARNENGEETTYSDSVVVTVPCFTATHDVAEGWNLVSLPMSVEENDKAVVFPSSTSNAFYYQAGYTEENNLQPGKGYWLKFDSGETFSRMGVPTFTDTISVHTGWNIIGSVSGSVPIGNITSIPPGLVTSQIFGYSGSYFSTSTIEPGQGYWVKAANDGELILSSVISYSSLSKIKIVLTSELPPPPPSGSTNTTIIPSEFALEQNYPNPFNPTTVIQYSVPGSQYVSLKIYNILGEEVATLVNEVQTSGFKSQVWDANGLPSGLYYYRLVAGDFVETKSMSLIK